MKKYIKLKELNQSIKEKTGKDYGLCMTFTKDPYVNNVFDISIKTSSKENVAFVRILLLNTQYRIKDDTLHYMYDYANGTDSLYSKLKTKRIYDYSMPIWFIIEENIMVNDGFRSLGVSSFIQNNLFDIVTYYKKVIPSYIVLMIGDGYYEYGNCEDGTKYRDILYKHYTKNGFRLLSRDCDCFMVRHNKKAPWKEAYNFWEINDVVLK